MLDLFVATAICGVGIAPPPQEAAPAIEWTPGRAPYRSDQGFGGLGRFQALSPTHRTACISSEQMAELMELARHWQASHGSSSPTTSSLMPAPYAFFPAGANPGQDLLITGFVDLDPAPFAFHDFECGSLSRDTHDGVDANIRGFEEQDLGIPILAAQDGVVFFTRDGHPDMNLNGSPDPGNYVGIDHGNGRVTWYFHLKKDSIGVQVNQTVRAGEQVGLAASSGNSYYPHLHFSTYDNNVNVEPFAGPCRAGASGWNQQPTIRHNFHFLDGATTWQDLWQNAPLPWPQPRDGDFALTDGLIYFWFQAEGLAPNSVWRHVFERPDNTVALDSGDLVIGNTQEEHWYTGFWNFWVNDMHTIPGTWHWKHIVNGVEAARIPIEVVPTRTPGFNRAPLPLELALEPGQPTASDAILCRVQGDHLIDDLDYDVLTYRYEWRVDGILARDVTHAGRADALPAGTAKNGRHVQCAVTVNDGTVSNSPVLVHTVVGGGDPLVLRAPVPGSSGTTNTFLAEAASSGSRVYLAWSLAPQSGPLPKCPGRQLLLGPSPNLAGIQTANASGRARFDVNVPGAAAGRTAHFQAASLAPCAVSNLMTYSFP